MNEKQSGVTALNYAAKVRLFIGAVDKDAPYGVMINPIDHPHEWGAWRSYFQAIGKGLAHFDKTGRIAAATSRKEDRLATASYLVPARMPSDFDAGRDFVHDRSAGEAFFDAQQAARASAGRLAGRGTAIRHGMEALRAGLEVLVGHFGLKSGGPSRRGRLTSTGPAFTDEQLRDYEPPKAGVRRPRWHGRKGKKNET